MKKLLVMVSIYNSGEWIEHRLNNLNSISMKDDAEIWCVNANSPDERDHIIPQKFPFKYIKLEERITLYDTWNYIIQNAPRTEYVTQANTDDVVAPECYEVLSSALDGNDTQFSYCSWYNTDKPNVEWGSDTPLDLTRPGHFDGNVNRGSIGHFPMWRRSLHDSFGYFDPTFKALADCDWYTRCYYLGNQKFVWVDKPLAIYQWRMGENLWHRMITKEEWDRYHSNVVQYRNGTYDRSRVGA